MVQGECMNIVDRFFERRAAYRNEIIFACWAVPQKLYPLGFTISGVEKSPQSDTHYLTVWDTRKNKNKDTAPGIQIRASDHYLPSGNDAKYLSVIVGGDKTKNEANIRELIEDIIEYFDGLDYRKGALVVTAAFQDVESSNLDAVEYDDDNSILRIEFHSGSVYEFYDVPREKYEDLLDAGSLGHYFYYNIRDKYHYQKI